MLICLLISNLLNFVPKPLVLVSLSHTQGSQQSYLCAGSEPKFFLPPSIQQIQKASSGSFYAPLHKSDQNFSHYYSLSNMLLIWYYLNWTQGLTFCTSWNITQASTEAILSIFSWSDHCCRFKSEKRIWDPLLFTENSPQPLIVWRGWCF